MMSKKKRCVLVISGILLCILYSLIFSFSEQNGEESGSLSFSLSKFGVELWDRLTGGNMTAKLMEELALYFEHPLRKAAHFTEYAVMGILVYLILYCLVKKCGKRFFLCVLWVFLSAVADEFHQYFVPGRWSSMADVLLDTCGGVCGAIFCYLCICLRNRWVNRKQRMEQNCEVKG